MQKNIAAALFAGLLLLVSPTQGQQAECVGDCDQDDTVDVSEIVMGLSIALGSSLLAVCPTFDGNRNGAVDITDLVMGVSALLNGCLRTPAETPATPTATVTPGPNQIVYLLSGTLNDQPATGRMIWVPSERVFPNQIFYDVVSFAFGDLQGIGDADFFTLTNTFTIRLDAMLAGRGDIHLVGDAPLASNAPLLPGEFNVSSDQFTLVFTAEREGSQEATATSTREASHTPSVEPVPTSSAVATEAHTAGPKPTATPRPTATSTPSADDLFAELMFNRATWEEIGAVRYRMLERLGCFCFNYPRLVAIEVVEDQIISIRDVWTGAEVQDPPEDLYRTVDGIFELIAEAIRSGAKRISVEYSQFTGAPTDTFIHYARFDDQDGYFISDLAILSSEAAHDPTY